MDALIVSGHPPDAVWGYTPRQISAWLQVIVWRKKEDTAQSLSVGALAARGDPKEVKKAYKELLR